jgi:hypothetical protein
MCVPLPIILLSCILGPLSCGWAPLRQGAPSPLSTFDFTVEEPCAEHESLVGDWRWSGGGSGASAPPPVPSLGPNPSVDADVLFGRRLYPAKARPEAAAAGSAKVASAGAGAC